ncbi:MAG: maleylpyruvate isomerase family mycothiol-dependent enzyme [Micromonosporaceae bacterium]
MDPLVLLPDLERATDRLFTTVQGLSDGELGTPSLLPNWTRGHVLAHLARNADGLCNLLTWARTGEETPQYPSQQVRDGDIESGAPRPLAAQLADLRSSAARFGEQAAALPTRAWAATVRTRGDTEVVAATLVWMRLREVEIHHVDLDAGYRPDAWPASFTQHLTHELTHHFADSVRAVLRCPELGHDITLGDPDGAPIVAGPAYAVAAWLIGRSPGTTLTVTPAGGLPPVPPWR